MTKTDERIGFLGGGTIAFGIGSRLISQGVVKPSHVYASGPNVKHLEGWRQIGAHVTDKNGFVVTKCDIIFICVKPHLMYQCAQQIESGIEPIVFDGDKLFLSVMTGVRLDQLELAFSFMKKLKIIRMMPNSPVQVGEGCTVYVPGRHITAQELAKLNVIFDVLGMITEVPESMMNALTALIGCGPAYAFTVIKAMSDGGIAQGLSYSTAVKFAAQTTLGAAKMVLETKKHPAILRDEPTEIDSFQISESGSATIIGMHELEKIGIRNGFINAIEEATRKNSELGTF